MYNNDKWILYYLWSRSNKLVGWSLNISSWWWSKLSIRYSTNCTWYNALTNKKSSNHRNHNTKGKLLLYLLLCFKLGQNDTIFETWDSCTSNTRKIANEPSLGSSIEVGSARFLNQSQLNISLRPIIQWPILPIIKIKSCSCESLLEGSLRNLRTFRPKSCGVPQKFILGTYFWRFEKDCTFSSAKRELNGES